MLPPDYVRPAELPAPTNTSDEKEAFRRSFPTLVLSARTLAEDNPGDLARGLRLVPPDTHGTRAELDADVDRVLRNEWFIGIDDSRGRMYMLPHIGPSNSGITGVKIRSGVGGSNKWALPGSRFTSLYGAHLPQRFRALLLCEGETDTLWAYLQAGVNADVRGLPAGASPGSIPDELVAEVRAWERVYLCFDADDAGVAATEAWLAALDYENVFVCSLPMGHDLRATQPNIPVLLREAVHPVRPPADIVVAPGSMTKLLQVTQQGQAGQAGMLSTVPVDLAPFSITPVARLLPPPPDARGRVASHIERALEVDAVYAGHQERIMLDPAALTRITRFREFAAGKIGGAFLGDDRDLTLLNSWLMAKASIVPEVFQTDRVGIHYPPAKYDAAGPSLVTRERSYGSLPWRWSGHAAGLGDVLYEDPAQAKPEREWESGQLIPWIDWSWLSDLFHLFPEELTHLIIGWMGAALRRPEFGDFPILFAFGPAGSGKSTYMRLAQRFFCSDMYMDASGQTPPPISYFLAGSTNIPILLDEYRIDIPSQAHIVNALSAVYSGSTLERGTADASAGLVSRLFASPTIVAGEHAFANDREAERTVLAGFARALQQPGSARRIARLEKAPVHRIGSLYMRWLLDTPAEDLPRIPSDAASDRYERQKEAIRCGWRTLRQFLEHQLVFVGDDSVQQVLQLMPFEPNLSGVDVAREEHDNPYEELLGLALDDTDRHGLPLVWWSDQDNATYVRSQQLMSPEVLHRYDVRPPSRSRGLNDYIRKELAGYQSRTVVMNESKRAMCIPNWHPLRGEVTEPQAGLLPDARLISSAHADVMDTQ